MKISICLSRILIGSMLLLCLATQAGCAFKRKHAAWKPTPIRVEKEQGLANDYIAMDIIGVDKGMTEQIKSSLASGAYFQIGGEFRASVLNQQPSRTFEFPPGETPDKTTIERKDKIWRAWKTNASPFLVVVANLSSRGNAVKIIPCEEYEQHRPKKGITLRLTKAGIVCSPANLTTEK